MKPKISTSLTTTGWGLILGSLFLYFSARSNDNNLLYLIGAATLSVIIGHFIVGWRNLSSLSVSWLPPEEGFVQTDLHPLLQIADHGNREHFQLSMGRDYLEKLEPKTSFCFHGTIHLKQRGKDEIVHETVSSLYPFGLSRFTLTVPPLTVWAYPTPVDCQIEGVQESMQATRAPSVDTMGDYWMLREYREGEDARQIHWHSSAKTDAEWVMVVAQPRQEPFRIWLDFRGVGGEALETFLSRISGLILQISQHPVALQLWVAHPVSPHSAGWFDLREASNRRIAWRWLAGLSCADAEDSVPERENDGFGLKPSHLHL